MAQKPSKIREFQKRFPDEDACLTHLMRNRFGERFTCFSCQKEATYYRVSTRRCFVCEHCGYQVYPTAGTPFEKTRTSLRDWFYVMFLFCETRNGVAAKEVQRQLGVTYKTAWRMCHLIRLYMGYVDGDFPIGGPGKTVEADETFIGGRRAGQDDKAIVLGMIDAAAMSYARGAGSHQMSCTRFRRHQVRCFMEQEVRHGEKAVYAGVQASGRPADQAARCVVCAGVERPRYSSDTVAQLGEAACGRSANMHSPATVR